jgi:hypothetical protein
MYGSALLLSMQLIGAVPHLLTFEKGSVCQVQFPSFIVGSGTALLPSMCSKMMRTASNKRVRFDTSSSTEHNRSDSCSELGFDIGRVEHMSPDLVIVESLAFGASVQVRFLTACNATCLSCKQAHSVFAMFGIIGIFPLTDSTLMTDESVP